MLLLQLQHTVTYTCSSDKGYKTANLYVGVMGPIMGELK